MEIKHLYLALALLATTFSMPGCDGDDDDDAKPDTEVNGGDDTPDETVGGTVPTIAEAVDLGLTSGTLWAPYNVGATAPGEAGAYFAWGETAAKSYYSWSTYKWMKEGESSWEHINKYTAADGQTSADWYTDGEFTGDGKTTLDPEDDAAAVNWGGKWVMPTMAQLKELFNECDFEWKAEGEYAEGSLAGYLLTSKTNGNTLFLPAAGGRWGAGLYYIGSNGYYWSAELPSGYSYYARGLYFYSGYWSSLYNDRFCGFSVRPVCPSAE